MVIKKWTLKTEKINLQENTDFQNTFAVRAIPPVLMEENEEKTNGESLSS